MKPPTVKPDSPAFGDAKRLDAWGRHVGMTVMAVITLTILIGLTAPAVRAQVGGLSMGDSVKNFNWPITENGMMKLKISGKKATKLSINRTEIEDMRIEVFDKGQPDMTITSPLADFWQQTETLRSRVGVTIDRGDMIISAKSMEWELKNKKGMLRRNVKVKLLGFDLGDPKSMAAVAGTPSDAAVTTSSKDIPAPEEEEKEDSDAPSIMDSPTPSTAPLFPESDKKEGAPSLF